MLDDHQCRCRVGNHGDGEIALRNPPTISERLLQRKSAHIALLNDCSGSQKDYDECLLVKLKSALKEIMFFVAKRFRLK